MVLSLEKERKNFVFNCKGKEFILRVEKELGGLRIMPESS